MKTDYKYIQFELIEQKPKTSVWVCKNIRANQELGQVKWYPAWRSYCYFPTVQAVYNDGCLKDIVDFIKQLMDERKKN
jgi:hypothetical protein